eukprot:scaffold1131_cov229-Pinguiococcus_pyrenoidosus.AAC.4
MQELSLSWCFPKRLPQELKSAWRCSVEEIAEKLTYCGVISVMGKCISESQDKGCTRMVIVEGNLIRLSIGSRARRRMTRIRANSVWTNEKQGT